MKKLVCSAIALSLTSAIGAANGDDWSVLDREVEALTTSNLALENNLSFGGFIRTRYDNGDPETFGARDIGGFHVNDARINATASLGDFLVHIEYDFADNFNNNTANGMIMSPFKDGYISFPIGDSINGRVGRFQSPILGSALVGRENLVFSHRTWSGENFSYRDEGAMISGETAQIGWAFSVQNGFEGTFNPQGGVAVNSDDKDDRLLISARVSAALTGERQAQRYEGSYGAGDDFYAEISAAFFENEANPAAGPANGVAIDLRAVTSAYSFAIDAVDYEDGGFTTNPNRPVGMDAIGSNAVGGTTPLSFTGTYMLSPNSWEAALRYQDGDDLDNSEQIDVGINHYIDGHALKFQAQYSQYESDLANSDRDLISIGLVASF